MNPGKVPLLILEDCRSQDKGTNLSLPHVSAYRLRRLPKRKLHLYSTGVCSSTREERDCTFSSPGGDSCWLLWSHRRRRSGMRWFIPFLRSLVIMKLVCVLRYSCYTCVIVFLFITSRYRSFFIILVDSTAPSLPFHLSVLPSLGCKSLRYPLVILPY